jgi:hypothetical protein
MNRRIRFVTGRPLIAWLGARPLATDRAASVGHP